MAITVELTGNGKHSGNKSALISYSVTEDSSPVDPSDTSGGTGQFSFSVMEDESPNGSILLHGDSAQIVDQSNGRTTGNVNGLATSGGTDAKAGITQVTADSRLNILNSSKTAQPFNGTLGDAFRYYLSLCDITTGVVVDNGLETIPVVFKGWVGNVWDAINKQLAPAFGAEVSLVSNNVVFRPIRLRKAITTKADSFTWNVTNQDLAQSVEIYNYNTAVVTDTLVYPKGGWNDEVQVYSGSGAASTYNIPVDFSLTSLKQPLPQLTVAKTYSGPDSVYSASGGDGIPIPIAQWVEAGGNISVAIGADLESIDLTITWPTLPAEIPAPYSIAVSSGTSNSYSTLRIVGSGIAFNKELINFGTGISAIKSQREVGATIDNPFYTDLARTTTGGYAAANKWGRPNQTIGFSATVINRKGEKGTENYPTWDFVQSQWNGQTYADFDAYWVGFTYNDVDSYYLSLVQDNFDNQAFGNVGGARVKFRQAYYRIRSASVTPTGVSGSAEFDTIMDDVQDLWDGYTYSDFDTFWTGYKYDDTNLIPLWGYPRNTLLYPDTNLYPATSLYPGVQ